MAATIAKEESNRTLVKSTLEKISESKSIIDESVNKLIFEHKDVGHDLLDKIRPVEVKKSHIVPGEVHKRVRGAFLKGGGFGHVKHIAVTYKSLPGYQLFHNDRYWSIECTTELEPLEYSQFPEKLWINKNFDYSLDPFQRRSVDSRDFKELVLIPIDEFEEANSCLEEYNELTLKVTLNRRRVLKTLKAMKEVKCLNNKELSELKRLDKQEMNILGEPDLMKRMDVWMYEHKGVIERNDIKSIKLLRRSRDRIEAEQKKKRDLLVEKKRLVEELKSKQSEIEMEIREMEKSRE